MRIISIGEVLWDIIGETEHLGGAPFNFAAQASKLGHEVLFVSAVGTDERGDRVLQRMRTLNLSTDYVARRTDQPTGYVTVNLDSAGQPGFVIHRPAAYDFPGLEASDFKSLLSPSPDLIYFGSLQQMSAQAKELTLRVLESSPHSHRLYDVNLRPGCYNSELVRELLADATILKLNDEEMNEISNLFGERYSSIEQFSRSYSQQFELEAVCVTRGAAGCSLLLRGDYVESPGYAVRVVDAVGAGDAFAAVFAHGLAENWPALKIADFANRVGALIASRSGAIPPWTVGEAYALEPSSQRSAG